MSTVATDLLMTTTPALPRWRRALDGVELVVSSVMTVVVAVMAAVALVLAIATHFSTQGEYTIFGHPTLSVLSGSMTPTIRTGDLIFDHPVSGAAAPNLHVGQIITFRVGSGQTFTHRIVGVVHQPDGSVAYRTKGDANNMVDTDPRPASSVVGVYAGRIPRGGYILNALHKPLTLGLILASPILWFIAEPLRRWAREEEAKESAATADEAEGDGG